MVEIVAEIGSSHGGNLGRALKLIHESSKAGADTCKFQIFDGRNLWRSDDPRSKAVEKLSVPEKWLPALVAEANKRSIKLLFTPFSIDAVDMLDGISDTYKVASGDITFVPLLRHLSRKAGRVILSTGFSSLDEVETAIGHLRSYNRMLPLTLLHASGGGYPDAPSNYNLGRILDLRELVLKRKFNDIDIGLSSHVNEWWCDVAAVLYGVTLIEKHIKLGWPYRGPEDRHSLDPQEFKKFVNAVNDVELACIKHAGFTLTDEYGRKNYRRDPSDWLRPVKYGTPTS